LSIQAGQRQKSFDWIHEVKYDGYRGLRMSNTKITSVRCVGERYQHRGALRRPITPDNSIAKS
jgi:hypothetical protein